MQNVLEMPDVRNLFDSEDLGGKQSDGQPLPLLDAELVANRFPCFDLNTEFSAFTSHSSGGGYTNSTLAKP